MNKKSLVRAVLIGTIFVLVVFSGYFILSKKLQPKDQALFSPTENWKTYTNEKYGFSFEYPPELTTKMVLPTENPNSTEIDKIDPVNVLYYDYADKDKNTLAQVAVYDPNWTKPARATGDFWAGRKAIYFTVSRYSDKLLATKEGDLNSQIAESKKVEGAQYSKDGYENEIVTGDLKINIYLLANGLTYSHYGGVVYNKNYIINTFAYSTTDYNLVKNILSTFKFTNEVSSVDNSVWKTYTNDEYGFEFKYISSYKFRESVSEESWPGNPPLLKIDLAKDGFEGYNTQAFGIAVTNLKYGNINDWVSFLKKQYKNVAVSQENINGNNFTKVFYVWWDQHIEVAYIEHNGLLYFFNPTDETWSFLDTFKFTK